MHNMANSQLQLWSREVDFQSVKAKKYATTSCQLYKNYQLQEFCVQLKDGTYKCISPDIVR